MKLHDRPRGDDSDLPSTIGPYRITGVLSRGGMGVLYRGEHVETSNRVALKTVFHVEETQLASLRREIQALGRIRHPGVVRIVAEGIHDGLPWYAMELLEGRTLRDHLDQAHSSVVERGWETQTTTSAASWMEARPAEPGSSQTIHGGSAPATDLLKILRQLCAPLAFLHGNGVVHRDLKPENIFVRPDGTPVLIDLGLAALSSGARGHEELEDAGDVIGTIAYMAPEQIRGELVDARADIYSLGCILYECVVGTPPFSGMGVLEMLQAHLEDAPVPASHHVTGLPPELDRLILQLLEKAPRDRPGYADDISTALEALGTDPDASTGAAPGSYLYLYRPDFVGREQALHELMEAVKRVAQNRRGDRIYLGGESGVGKTRLAMEAVRSATQRGLTVVLGQCTSLGLGGGTEERMALAPLHPFAPLLLAVADRCRAKGAQETARLLGAGAKLLVAYQPALAALPEYQSLPEPVAIEPQAARARVLSALITTLFAFAETNPLVLVIDDLQWADELSSSFLQMLTTAELEQRRVLIIGTYRSEEMGTERESMLRVAGVRLLEVGRLGTSDVGSMVLGMLALREPPTPLVEFLHRECDGNPFFIAEYLRTAISEGLLTRDRAGRWRLGASGQSIDSLDGLLSIPRTLAELIESRLRALGDDGQALVRAAAVLGREFEGDLLAAATALRGDAGLDALAVLRVRQIVEEAGSGRLRFVHDKIREIAYASIPEAEIPSLHRHAAAALERLHPDASDFYPDLAHHHAKARVHDKASFYFTRAGERARGAYANGEAIAFYRAAISEEHKIPRSGESLSAASARAIHSLHEDVGDLLTLTGQQPSARAAYADALALVGEAERLRRARLHRKIGKAWEIHHDHERARQSYADAEASLGAEAVAPVEEWWRERVQVYLDRLWVSYWLNRVDEMRILVDSVRPIIDERGTTYQRVRFFHLLAMMNIRIERYVPSAETLAYARAAMTASDELNNLGESAAARFVLFFATVLHGALDEAEEHGLAVLKAAELTGAIPLRARCLTYLTVIARRRGDLAATRAWGTKCFGAASTGKMNEYLGVAHANLAWLAWREGDLESAERIGLLALETWRPQAVCYPLQWMALWPLLAIDVERDRIAEAVERARALVDPKQQRLPEALESALHAGISTWSSSGSPAARTHLTKALDSAQQLGFL